jgi:methyl-accepting chemotaxis protein
VEIKKEGTTMFKNMKLAVKIGVGFGMLILIACTLGGLAVYNMRKVKTVAVGMERQAVPSVKVANNVERYSLQTMYAARGYALAEEDQYRETAEKHLADVFKFLKEAQDLAGKEKIQKLSEAANAAEGKAKEYQELFKQTVNVIGKINEDRVQMNKDAQEYMNVCAAFLKSQNSQFDKEIAEGAAADKLKERLQKLNWGNDVVDLGNAVRMAAWKSQALRDPQLIEAAQPNFDKINATLDNLKKITHREEDLKEIEDCRAAGLAYKEAMNGLLANWKNLQAIGTKRGEVADQVLKQAQQTAEFGMETTTEGAVNASSSLSSASWIMIIGLSIGVIVGIILAIFITRSITGPIQKVIEGLSSGSEQVTSASGQVSSASQSLAQGASEQASSLEETSSALEEMASMTRQNADNANMANGTAKEANTMALEGVDSMKRMAEAIERIKNSASETAKIIKTIDEIAFQTNLLALNAAVEAARAGEAGKGFAVVAEEVRNLARRSAEAAKNTADLIEGAQKNAEAGVNVSTEVAKNLNGIQDKAGKVATLIAEIAAASKEQSQGIDQVNTAVSEMDKVVQQNAANAEESASASEELSSQAQELNAMVEELIGIVGGAGHNGGARGHLKTASRAAPKQLAAAPASHGFTLKNRVQTMAEHQAAMAGHKPALKAKNAAKPATASEVIPLDEEELMKI